MGLTNVCRRPVHGLRIGTGMLVGTSVLLVASTGCQSRYQPSPLGKEGEAQVQLVVVQGDGGGTMVFLPVYIDGKGPFSFALDTGASHSVINQTIAEELGLPESNLEVQMSGIAAHSDGRPVTVSNWAVGDTKLPDQVVVALPMRASMTSSGMQGLLGSDMLSRFDRITINYAGQVLTLGPAESGSATVRVSESES